MKLCMGCMEQIEDNITTCPHCGYDETTLRQESYYLDPGTVVGGKYIVGRVISYGGYTITYLGMDAETNRKVMVKEYLPSDFSTRSEGESEVTIYSGDALEQFEQGLTTFLNEANRIQQLGSVQGIARVYDCVAENDTGYVISEYLEGQTLKEILDSGRIFTPQETKDFISQILAGLGQVHPLDIIHCDIAPETIMVTNTGEIKLLDFGATRYVTTANSKSLAIILKQGYAPEEQYRSKGVRGPWTDVYAVAAVMYRMLTGKTPMESVERALVDELQEPSKLGISIPQNMENAMMNALNVYQKDRTPSAEVFLRELNSEQVKRIQVKKQKYETGKFPKWAKGLVACLLCVVLAGGGLVGYKYLNQEDNDLKSSEDAVPNLLEKEESEAKKELDDQGLIYEEGTINYDQAVTGGSVVIGQDPAAGNQCPEDKKVKCNITTSLKCYYSDLSTHTDANDLAVFLNIGDDLKEASTEEDCDDDDHVYYDLYEIQLKNGEIIKPSAFTEKNKTILVLAEIKKITYYVSPFFYEENFSNYVGKYYNDVELAVFELDKEKNRIPKGVRRVPKSKVSQVYYSLDPDKKEGYIVSQHVNKGDKYDSSKNKGPIFDVVKKSTSVIGNSYRTVVENLKKMGIKSENIEYEGEEDGIVTKYKVENNNNKAKWLMTDDSKITLHVEPKPTPTPTPAPIPSTTSNGREEDSSNGSSIHNENAPVLE